MKVRMFADLRVMPLIIENMEGSQEDCQNWANQKIEEMSEYLHLFSSDLVSIVLESTGQIALYCNNRHKALVIITYEK